MPRRFQNPLHRIVFRALLATFTTLFATLLPASAQRPELVQQREPITLKPRITPSPTVVPAANWVQASPATSPSARYGASMAYDTATGNLVLFGGFTGSSYVSDTWVWNGTTWTQQSPAASPSPRYAASMAYDAATGNLVLFGGYNSDILGDTWVWNGTTWTQQSLATSPSARYYPTMAYDEATGNVVLFGGVNGTYFTDTWVWNGTTWTQQSTATSPSERYGQAVGYDAAAGNLVLFGGDSGSNAPLSDTWLWNGSTWAQQSPATSPPVRALASMAYDPATGSLLLFGGKSNSIYLSDNWTWNGTTWAQPFTSTTPPPRANAAAAYDTATASVVLFGGIAGGNTTLGDTWNYVSGTPTIANTAVGSSTTSTAMFTFPNGGSIGAPVVLTKGATGLDFTDNGTGSCTTNGTSHVYNAGDTCTVVVKFAPKYPGQRLGAVEIVSTSGNGLATELISGIGTGPLATFTPGTINALAGSGTQCSSSTSTCGDGGTALASTANFYRPFNVALDGAGNVYISDTLDNRVRKVTAATGILSTIAGTGALCPTATAACGDGGLATSATFVSPTGITVDGAGNIYIVDAGDNRVRMITAATGTISTVAGTGPRCSPATAACGDGGLATAAGAYLDGPLDVALDAMGNIYIADTYIDRIRKVTAATGILSTVAGSGNPCLDGTTACGDGGAATAPGAEFYEPSGIAVDSVGNLYIADYFDNRIRKVTAGTNILSTVAGSGTGCPDDGVATCGDGGLATDPGAELSGPTGVALDAAGNLFIADLDDSSIRKVTAASGILSTVAGGVTNSACSGGTAACGDGGPATASGADLNEANGIALDGAGNLYIADSYDNRIRMVTATAATVGFADTTIGNTSPTQTLITNNIGNTALSFPIPAVGSTNPFVGTEFNVTNSSTCPQLTSSSGSAGTLAAGNSCTYVLNFQPVATGAVAHFLTLTDNSLNASSATQNAALTGSTGGDGVGVNNATAAQGSTAVPLSFTVGYGGNALPTGTPTLTVNGSATGVGTITCIAKAGHNLCSTTYNASSLPAGPYTITATQPADSTYLQAVGTGTLTIAASGVRRPKPMLPGLKPVS